MRARIRRLGISQGVVIPKGLLEQAGFAIDCPIEMTVDGASIVLRKIGVPAREGWAEDAASLAAEDEDLLWLDADLGAR